MKWKKEWEATGEQMTLFSPVASPDHASPTQQQENDLAKKMTVTSGQKCLESYERFSRHGLWARMFSGLLIGMTGWSSMRCNLTWKLKGTKSNRMYFQLLPLALLTDETEYGLLLKTPCAADAYTENLKKKEQAFGNSGTLAQEVLTGFIYKRGILPTPVLMDYRGAKTTESLETCGRDQNNSLPDFFAQTGRTSQLNPRFVAEMMGFPPNWTELPFQDGETKA
jgi:hypothetical protein